MPHVKHLCKLQQSLLPSASAIAFAACRELAACTKKALLACLAKARKRDSNNRNSRNKRSSTLHCRSKGAIYGVCCSRAVTTLTAVVEEAAATATALCSDDRTAVV